MIWLLTSFLLQIITLSVGIFTHFYIWEQTQTLSTIIVYDLGIFLSFPFFALFIAWIIEFLGLKFSHLFSIIITLIFVILLLLIPQLLSSQPFQVGLFRGLSLGLLTITTAVLNQKLTSDFDADLDKLGAIQTLASIIITPLMAFSIFYFTSYSLLYLLSAFVALILLIIYLFLPFPQADQSFSWSAALWPFNSTNPEKTILTQSQFFNGIKDGFFFSIVPIVTLYFAGSLRGWGIFIFLLSLLDFALNFIYSKLFQAKQSLLVSGLGAIIFTLSAVVFVSNFNLLGIIIFSIGNTLLGVLFGNGFSTSISRLSSIDSNQGDTTIEYSVFTAIVNNFGRLLPIVAFYFLQPTLSSPGVIEVVVFITSLIPFTIMGVLSRSFVLRHSTDLDQLPQSA